MGNTNRMAYKFRKVKCYDCGYIFMWSRDFEHPYNQAYKLKDTDEVIYRATYDTNHRGRL